MLETISKSIKSGTSDNLSENLSSVSKGEKIYHLSLEVLIKRLFRLSKMVLMEVKKEVG